MIHIPQYRSKVNPAHLKMHGSIMSQGFFLLELTYNKNTSCWLALKMAIYNNGFQGRKMGYTVVS
jgi:hypothetical protein